MSFPTRAEYALRNSHKINDLVRLNQHAGEGEQVYKIAKVDRHAQFAYIIRNFDNNQIVRQATWQHHQLIALTEQTDPEYFL